MESEVRTKNICQTENKGAKNDVKIYNHTKYEFVKYK